MRADVASALLGPSLAAVLSMASVGLRDWQQKRSLEFRRKQAMVHANALTSFAEFWIKTQKLVSNRESLASEERQAKKYLEQASSIVSSAWLSETGTGAAPAPSPNPSGPTLPAYRRLFFLYRPATFRGYVAHILFGFSVLWAGVVVVTAFADPAAWARALRVASVWQGFGYAFVLGLAPILPAYVAALWLERHRHRQRGFEDWEPRVVVGDGRETSLGPSLSLAAVDRGRT